MEARQDLPVLPAAIRNELRICVPAILRTPGIFRQGPVYCPGLSIPKGRSDAVADLQSITDARRWRSRPPLLAVIIAFHGKTVLRLHLDHCGGLKEHRLAARDAVLAVGLPQR
jgi:hypothetical protein